MEQKSGGSQEYEEEVLCAGWIPAESLCPEVVRSDPDPPAVPELDVDAILAQLYAHQRC